jgi:gentisate 1,2-dioxygenase
MAETQIQDEFHEKMAAAGVKALWERTVHNPREPLSEPPRAWRWAEIEPLLDMAVSATSMDAAERRVLSLANPDLDTPGGASVTTNLNAGIQVLLPGETARVHRHTANALRFVLEGGNGTTTVDGKVCPMNKGDLILTPGGTWHEHTHAGDSRIVWLDSLDVPFHRSMHTQFFDPGPAGNFPPLPPDAAYHNGGLVPQAGPGMQALAYSPQFRFAWEDVCATLEAMEPAEDGSKTLRYANPATGGPAMNIFDLYMIELAAGEATVPFRTTANGFCLVVEGEGQSTVGEQIIEWGPYDVFTMPHWNRYSHKATGAGAKLFMGTDREILRRLELLREERG